MKFAVVLLASALTLAGCASFRTAAPGDPIEPINRGIYSFNSTFDHYLFKPIAKGYDAVVPDLVKSGVSNVFRTRPMPNRWSVTRCSSRGENSATTWVG